jgi:cell division protein FtsW
MKSEVKKLKVDKVFLILTGILLGVGIGIFLSASLSLISVNPDKFKNILFNQLVLGLIGGVILIVGIMQFSYKELRPWGYVIGIIAIGITGLVFVPGIGFSHGGATRWLNLGPLSFQPVELLKYCVIVAYAAWLSIHYKKISDYRYGMLPFLAVIGVTGGVLLAQPDTDNFMIIAAACASMYFIAGARWRDIVVTIILGLVRPSTV